MEELSIIIPTYNRPKILKEVLIAINKQNYDLKKVEVLVIDDFSRINIKKIIKDLRTDYKLRYIKMKKNCGQGIARNKGIKLSKGRYLLFIGDDMIPNKDLINNHMKLHLKNRGIAVLGRVIWDERVKNEFMDYIEKVQFHYNTIRDYNNVKLHFYTSNISLEKRWLINEKYSSKFKNYGL